MFISVVTNKGKHLFIWLLAIYISFFKVHLCIFIFLLDCLLVYKNYLCILDMSDLTVTCVANVFFHFVSFHFPIVSFYELQNLILIVSALHVLGNLSVVTSYNIIFLYYLIAI